MKSAIDLPKGWKLFRDIPDGSHFEDSHGRKFIKLVSSTALGLHQKFERIIEGSTIPLEFNSVDYDGIMGRCPNWVPFKVLKNKK